MPKTEIKNHISFLEFNIKYSSQKIEYRIQFVSICFQLSNCTESFYQQLLQHSQQIGSKEEQRTQAMHAFRYYNLDFPPAGPEACEANFVSAASYSAAMFYSPTDQQAVIFINTW